MSTLALARPTARKPARPDRAAHAEAPRSASGPLIMRKAAGCACGGGCPRCTTPVSQPTDALEIEADRVASEVMARSAAPPRLSALGQPTLARSAVPGAIPGAPSPVPRAGGEPLSAPVRAFFEPRFGADFGAVRVHHDTSAARSAERLGAEAYAEGEQIHFAAGRFEPHNDRGRRLLAHELAHTLQARAGRTGGVIQRRWDAATECAGASSTRWIERIVVDQTSLQTVTVHWNDGSTESDQCSTGKGHCCVEPGAAAGGTCSPERSRIGETNCTPITTGAGRPVLHRVLDHGGVAFWTEIDHDRAIALHEYSPVDGTPLSHGCIRLNQAMAITIFCGSRQNRTLVQIVNVARPLCNHPELQREWMSDFATAGDDSATADGERRRQILEERRALTDAFGRRMTRDQYNALTADDMPRCRLASAEEERALDRGTARAPTPQAEILAGSGFAPRVSAFTRALRGARDLAAAQAVVTQHGRDLWAAATARAQAASADTDDRPLYWARLQMASALRLWQPAFALLPSARSRLLADFEQTSRGMGTARFVASAGSGVKRILISGFDPFGFTRSTAVGNPSGAAVLALDGQTLSSQGISAEIQGVIFPVRFADFNAGIVESLFAPFLTGPAPLDMIMTISQGGSSEFEVENFAGRRRTTGFDDNTGLPGDFTLPLAAQGSTPEIVPPGLATGAEFIPTTLPTAALRGGLGRTAPLRGETEIIERPAGATAATTVPTGGPTAGSTAVEGSGGNFLSNEIQYRTSVLRVQRQAADGTAPVIPVGHLHTPVLMTPSAGVADPVFIAERDRLVGIVRTLLQSALPAI